MFLAIVSLVPPGIYEDYVRERDYCFFHLPLLVLMAVCLFAFCLGSYAAGHKRKYLAIDARAFQQRRFFRRALALWLVLASLWIIIFFLTFSFSDLALLYIAQEVNAVSYRAEVTELLAANRIGWIIPALLCCQVALYLSSTSTADVKPYRSRKALFYGTAAAFLVMVALTFTRSIAVYFAIEIYLLSSCLPKKRVQRTLKNRLALFAAALALVAFMVAIENYRESTTSGSSTSIAIPLGYFTGSMNRAAAVIDGSLELPGHDAAYYTLSWVWHFPLFGSTLYGVGRSIDDSFPADVADGHTKLFSSVARAGLNDHYVWPTVFGTTFSELGWISPLLFFMLGIVYAAVYKKFCRSRPYFVLLYPYMIVMLFLWLAGTVVFSRFIVIYMVAAWLLTFRITAGATHRMAYIDVTQGSSRSSRINQARADEDEFCNGRKHDREH